MLNGQEFYPDYGDNSFSAVFRYFGELQKHAVTFDSVFPRQSHSSDFIVLRFREVVIPSLVYVYEVYNPGYLRAIHGAFLFEDGTDKGWGLLWTSLRANAEQKSYQSVSSQQVACNLESKGRVVNSICLEFDCSMAPYYTEIDCVELVGLSVEVGSVNPWGIESSVDESVNNGVIQICKGIENLDVAKSGDHSEVLSTNYLFGLPDEIILNIFEFLSLSDITKVSVTCARLYRLANDYSLYQDLNFRPYWLSLDDKLLTSFASRAKAHSWNPQYVSFAWCYKLSPGSIHSFLTLCSNMKYLNLSNIAPQTLEALDFNIVKNCCPLLASLKIRLNNQEVDWKFLAPLKGLAHLSFDSIRISPKCLLEFFTWVSTNEILKFLSLDQFEPRMSPNNTNSLLELLVRNCPNLQCLNLCRSGLNHESFIILARMKNLNSLDAGWTFNADTTNGSEYNSALCQMFNSNRGSYKKLFFTACRLFSSSTLACVAETQSNLEVIDLLGISLIKMKSLELLMKRCPNLKYIDISYASSLSNPEIIFLMRKYPNVSIKRAHSNKDNEETFQKLLKQAKNDPTTE